MSAAKSSSSAASSFPRYARVALPLPLVQTFSYGVPRALDALAPGCRVKVRFGPRVLIGCVVQIEDAAPTLPPGTKILPILASLDPVPVLGEELLSLAEWIADYYVAPPGEGLRGFLPPDTGRAETVLYRRKPEAAGASLREGSLRARVLSALEKPMTSRALARAVGSRAVSGALRFLVDAGLVERVEKASGGGIPRIWAAAITDKGRQALESDVLKATTARVLTLLATATDAVPLKTIRSELGLKQGPFRTLTKRDYIRLVKQEALAQSPWSRLSSPEEEALTPTPDQRQVISQIERSMALRQFSVMVLYGVTGSGKTEIYLRAVEAALAAGRGSLLLVPEIALTPRLAGLLRQRFQSQVAILHSALGSGERRDEWWRIRRGEARVAVGARAAVLAPLERLGLIVVDEEQEGSYKQEETPRYNARDVAIKRAQAAGAVIVLGSATPSLESYTHAVEGRYRLARLPERIAGRPLASVRLIDMKEVVRQEGPETILSQPLREAIEARTSAGEQALVLLNRRGYATQLVCRECGLAANCNECSVALTLHQKGRLAVCHYCGLGRSTPTRCDMCSGEYLHQRGYGTERVEELLKATFPQIRVSRMDRDTMRRKGSYEGLLSRFAAGEIDLLVGTQMLAKGHDFPAVTLVGVLAADVGLGVPDFRAAERTFQLLTQVSGRAGRGSRAGEVLIQTFCPEHYALRHASAQDYQAFYEEEMSFRRALRYPPGIYIINLIVEGAEMSAATRQARRVAEELNRARLAGVEVLGPAFAARSKVAGRYRCQILLKVPRSRHREVRRRIHALMEDPELSKLLTVDVDPTTLH
ncbi:MAG TPA: primosomal protein N' [Vicinamibacteria bacterium]|nr:primosomal protein N' [Vicinamibacteria bacterium]